MGDKKKEKKISLRFVSSEEKFLFLENLSMLIGAGMDIATALDNIKQDVRSKPLLKAINFLLEEVEAGNPFWKSLEKVDLIPPASISFVRIGEESGTLVKNLRMVVEQAQKNKAFKSKLRSAMIYPAFVLTLSVVIGIGIAWFILPSLADIFSSLNIELPFITKVLIWIGQFLGEYGIYVVPSFIVIVFLLFYFLFVYSKTKFIGQNFLFSLPGIKRLVMQIELARTGYILGTLMSAGLPVVDSFDSLEKATSTSKYQKFYRFLHENLEDGVSFRDSFEQYKNADKFFPRAVQQLIVAGENSGSLDTALLEIGENYERKTDLTAKNLTVILEPLMLFIVWIAVLIVALSVILPIYSLVGSINQ